MGVADIVLVFTDEDGPERHPEGKTEVGCGCLRYCLGQWGGKPDDSANRKIYGKPVTGKEILSSDSNGLSLSRESRLRYSY
jgi:hypothetical protein